MLEKNCEEILKKLILSKFRKYFVKIIRELRKFWQNYIHKNFEEI